MKKLSSWTNVQDIFKANAGNGAKMNQDVFGSLEAQGNAAQQGLAGAETGFRNAAEKSRAGTLQGMNGSTADAAEAAGNARYTGPRTLQEYDPKVGQQIADAAGRINASPMAQYQQQYKGQTAGAGGSALDMALMNQEGGQQQSAAVKGKFGTLLDQLKQAQGRTQAIGEANDRNVSEAALGFAARAPMLRQSEATNLRLKQNAELAMRNDAARAAADADWERRTGRFKAKRGNQLQAAYQPPESEEVPYYPAS